MFSIYTNSKKRHLYNLDKIAESFYLRKINLNCWKISSLQGLVCFFRVIFEELNIKSMFWNANFLTPFLVFGNHFVKYKTIARYLLIQICKITFYLLRKNRSLSLLIRYLQLTCHSLKRNKIQKNIAIYFRAPSV